MPVVWRMLLPMVLPVATAVLGMIWIAEAMIVPFMLSAVVCLVIQAFVRCPRCREPVLLSGDPERLRLQSSFRLTCARCGLDFTRRYRGEA